MKLLKIISLGIGIWSLSLLWPNINTLLTGAVMLRLILALSALKLIFVLGRHLGRDRNDKPKGSFQDHASHPIPVIVLPH